MPATNFRKSVPGPSGSVSSRRGAPTDNSSISSGTSQTHSAVSARRAVVSSSTSTAARLYGGTGSSAVNSPRSIQNQSQSSSRPGGLNNCSQRMGGGHTTQGVSPYATSSRPGKAHASSHVNQHKLKRSAAGSTLNSTSKSASEDVSNVNNTVVSSSSNMSNFSKGGQLTQTSQSNSMSNSQSVNSHSLNSNSNSLSQESGDPSPPGGQTPAPSPPGGQTPASSVLSSTNVYNTSKSSTRVLVEVSTRRDPANLSEKGTVASQARQVHKNSQFTCFPKTFASVVREKTAANHAHHSTANMSTTRRSTDGISRGNCPSEGGSNVSTRGEGNTSTVTRGETSSMSRGDTSTRGSERSSEISGTTRGPDPPLSYCGGRSVTSVTPRTTQNSTSTVSSKPEHQWDKQWDIVAAIERLELLAKEREAAEVREAAASREAAEREARENAERVQAREIQKEREIQDAVTQLTKSLQKEKANKLGLPLLAAAHGLVFENMDSTSGGSTEFKTQRVPILTLPEPIELDQVAIVVDEEPGALNNLSNEGPQGGAKEEAQVSLTSLDLVNDTPLSLKTNLVKVSGHSSEVSITAKPDDLVRYGPEAPLKLASGLLKDPVRAAVLNVFLRRQQVEKGRYRSRTSGLNSVGAGALIRPIPFTLPRKAFPAGFSAPQGLILNPFHPVAQTLYAEKLCVVKNAVDFERRERRVNRYLERNRTKRCSSSTMSVTASTSTGPDGSTQPVSSTYLNSSTHGPFGQKSQSYSMRDEDLNSSDSDIESALKATTLHSNLIRSRNSKRFKLKRHNFIVPPEYARIAGYGRSESEYSAGSKLLSDAWRSYQDRISVAVVKSLSSTGKLNVMKRVGPLLVHNLTLQQLRDVMEAERVNRAGLEAERVNRAGLEAERVNLLTGPLTSGTSSTSNAAAASPGSAGTTVTGGTTTSSSGPATVKRSKRHPTIVLVNGQSAQKRQHLLSRVKPYVVGPPKNIPAAVAAAIGVLPSSSQKNQNPIPASTQGTTLAATSTTTQNGSQSLQHPIHHAPALLAHHRST